MSSKIEPSELEKFHQLLEEIDLDIEDDDIEDEYDLIDEVAVNGEEALASRSSAAVAEDMKIIGSNTKALAAESNDLIEAVAAFGKVLASRNKDWINTKSKRFTARKVSERLKSVVEENEGEDVVAYDYKRVALIENERLKMTGSYVGKRDGLLLVFNCTEVPGQEGEEIILEVPFSDARDMLVTDDKDQLPMGTVAERLLEADGINDIASKMKEEVERARAEEIRRLAVEKQEKYGEKWGAW